LKTTHTLSLFIVTIIAFGCIDTRSTPQTVAPTPPQARVAPGCITNNDCPFNDYCEASGQCFPNAETDDGCVAPAAFWRTNPDAYQWTELDPFKFGAREYVKEELIAILETPTGSDASLFLARQLIVAHLNHAGGNGAPQHVIDAVNAAHTWLAENEDQDGTVPFGIDVNTPSGQEAFALVRILEHYNTGQDLKSPAMCFGVCD
jgi:hypothetical protein